MQPVVEGPAPKIAHGNHESRVIICLYSNPLTLFIHEDKTIATFLFKYVNNTVNDELSWLTKL